MTARDFTRVARAESLIGWTTVTPVTSGEFLSLVPLLLAVFVPASVLVTSFFIPRRVGFPNVAVKVTTLAAVCAVLAVILHPVLALAGFDSQQKFAGSVMNDVVQLGLVSSCLFVLVSILAVVVVRFARTYLAGQKELDRFARAMLLTVASATILTTSNHLAVLVLAWFATDIGLHQLLTFFRNRRQAIIVAHKKFLLSRVADACFVGSLVLVGGELGTLRIDEINAIALKMGSLSPTLHAATVLLVIGVLLKSAQIPFHGWMQAVMEAPTPVSALLHAGVVNIGGFVMIRLAPLMMHAYIAQSILIGVGLFTTVVAALVMTTRVAIKGALAWSTIGQMGFMLVQCGLGAWHLALMHLLAPSLYKAHTFLSSGSIVQQWRANHIIHHHRLRYWHFLGGLILVCIAVGPFYLGAKIPALHLDPIVVGPLTLVLALSFAPMVSRALAAGGRTVLISMLYAVGATAAYFAWHIGFELLAPQINFHFEPSLVQWEVVVGGLLVLFLLQTVLQTSPTGWFANRIQPHLVSGLYIDDWVTRVTFRLWPPSIK
ncbi:NADH-quinone oxidoreductase subunit L [soil metagenome]